METIKLYDKLYDVILSEFAKNIYKSTRKGLKRDYIVHFGVRFLFRNKKNYNRFINIYNDMYSTSYPEWVTGMIEEDEEVGFFTKRLLFSYKFNVKVLRFLDKTYNAAYVSFADNLDFEKEA